MIARADGVPLRQCFGGLVSVTTPQLRWMKVAVDWCRALPRAVFRNV